MNELQSRHLFDMELNLEEPILVGSTPAGQRRIFTVSGGTFTGGRLRGQVLARGGSDLLLGRANDSFAQDVRLILRADDGAIIVMTYRGVRPGDYLRTVPFFETGDNAHAWINNIVCVAIGERIEATVKYQVFEVL